MQAHCAEIASINEATQCRMNDIQQSLTLLLQNQNVTHASSSDRDHTHVGNSSNEVHTANPQPFPTRRMNFDLPRFDSSDALGWIFNFDQYFSFYQVSDEQQIVIARMHMSGPAIPWFQMQQCTMPFRSWNKMKRAIEIEFGPTLFESPRESLFKLQQQGTVSKYYTEFITLANRTNIEPTEALCDCFISGLRMEIRREVKAQCPTSLMRVVSLAKLYEDKLSSSFKTTQGPNPYRPTNLV
ncbi:uncharacterized protein LOC108327042 isoform X1 [Vigna angularis]|uniref:uncharacterized protein LOC108327042 isoform X1 n=1 Tax=Phaseolus angularis TaxID=3914 RepID=UPI0022B34AC0|nr:uncharacterized protein LOC108327042 isoform X1 [Vigna angularis]